MRLFSYTTALTLAACSPVAAEDARNLDITAPCNTAAYVFNLMEEHKEQPFFTGTGTVQGSKHNNALGDLYPGGLQVWANLDEQTYSITIMFPDGMICLLSSGTNFKPYSGPHPNDIMNKHRLKDKEF